MTLVKNKYGDYKIKFANTTPSKVKNETLTISNKWRVINI